ncbi:hypothetical protein ENUP19_0054G0100 [Entamoeba nuttalli]|uniref:Beige/BEACH domain containing protein n=2 Tax=Entamoeba nuttalli TaxID=412467 RepID=K2H5R5_ENTNP|nr:Beige/BEACH domain containing protein [Entamoeba nuttalli P19]EKE37829.1 Beige/BEACH domain containing protein [Entamoeba nuttalli P19]|eukprot:XP_008859835.1 Beige/BEACH domain containing protein [Entamoeba nuttalli P19]
MNLFNLFRPRSKTISVQPPIQPPQKSIDEIILLRLLNEYKQEPSDEKYNKVITEIIQIYCKNPKQFPIILEYTGIIEHLFENIKIYSNPKQFIEEIMVKRFNELCSFSILTHTVSSKFTNLQIECICEIVYSVIDYVIVSPPNIVLDKNPLIFPMFEHQNQIASIPVKITPVKSTPQSQIISYALSLVGPFCYLELPDLLFVDKIQPQTIDAFIDHYYRYIPLHISSTPSPLVKRVKVLCANLVESKLTREKVNQQINTLMRLIVCLTKTFPESPVDFPGLFPYGLSVPPSPDCLTYYFNVIQATNNFTFVLPMVYSLSFFIQKNIEDYYFILLRKVHLYAHSVGPNISVFQEQLNTIVNDSNKKQCSVLLNGFIRIIECLSIEERKYFFEFIKKNSKNIDIIEPIIDGLSSLQLSRFYIQEFILESGLSYYIRQTAINSTGAFRIKTLKYLVQLMRDNDVLKYFKTTEPNNFFSSMIRSVSNKEEFELSIEFMTLLLLDDDTEKINQSIGYIKLFKLIDGLNELEYKIQLMKLWKLKIGIGSEDCVRDFMCYLKKCFYQKNGNKEFFTTFFDSFSSLKENVFGKKLFVEFMKEDNTFNRIKEIYSILGNDIFVILRNIALTTMLNIIDEPTPLILVLKLLLSLKLTEECSDTLIGDIFIPLISQCENLDVLSHGEIPELLIPFVIQSKKASHADFLIKSIISYHCNHHVLEQLIKNIHQCKHIHQGLDSIIISSFELIPTPTYFLDISQHLVNKISFKLPFYSVKPFTTCTWFYIHSFPEYQTPSVSLFSFASPQHTLGIHATPVGITIYFKNSRELLQFPIREKMFHSIVMTLHQTDKSNKCKIEIYLDSIFLGSVVGIATFENNTEMIVQSTEQVRLRIGNILIYRTILEDAAVQRLVYCENPDLVPSNENWFCPIDIRTPKECNTIPFSFMVNVRTKQVITQKEIIPINIPWTQPLINSKQQDIGRCIHGKKMLELLGGYDILLILMAEMKDNESVLAALNILTKYLSKNGKASYNFCEVGGLKIMFDILNARATLFNEIGLVETLLEFSTDHQKEVFTSPLLVDKIVLNVDFWKKGNDDVIRIYLEKVALSLKSPHVQSTIGMLEECRVFERFLQFIDRSIQNKNIRSPFIAVMSGLLQLSSWRSYLHQIAMIVQSNYSTEQIIRCTVFNENTNQGESVGNVAIRNLINNIDVSNSSDTEGMDTPSIESLVLVLQILLTRALSIEDKDQVCEFLTTASSILPIGVILELVAIVKKQYINDVLKYMCLILSIQPIYSKFIRLGGFVRLFNSLRSVRRVYKYTYSTIKIISSFLRTIFLMNFDKGNTMDIASDPSLVLLLCTLNEIPTEILGMIVKEFSENCIKPEGRNLVSCKMYNEVVFHSILNVVHRNDDEKILNGLLLMYDSGMNEAQKRSVQQVATKVHLHYLYFTSLVMSDNFESRLLWRVYVFIADMHKKYVVTQGRRSHKLFFINAIARIWKEVLQYDLPLSIESQRLIIEKLSVRDFIVQFEQRQALFEEKYNNISVAAYYVPLLKTLGLTTILSTELLREGIQGNSVLIGFNEFTEEVKNELHLFVNEIYGTIERKEYLHPYLVQIQPTTIPNDLDFIRPPPRSFKTKPTSPSRVACLHWLKIFKKYTSPKGILAYQFPPPISAIKLTPFITPSFVHNLVDYSSPKMRDLPTTEEITPEIIEELKNYLQIKELVPYIPPIALTCGIKCKRIKEEEECEGMMQIKEEADEKELVFQYSKVLHNENISKEIILPLKNAIITKKMYLYQDNGLEIITADGRIEFFIFTNKQRNKIIEVTGCSESKLLESTKMWSKGLISNFEYLGIVNNEAGRSYRTLSQYPIYPWVICSYDSKDFRLSDIQMYRNLQLPIGAQKETNQIEDNYYEKECHYNCCLSSPSTVLRCLFRLRPYTDMILKEMSGRCLEIDGRMFVNVGSLFLSSVLQSRIELLPEFYCCPEVFMNLNHLKGESTTVGDVNFPPWGETSRLFIHHMREALESQEVGQTINQWIDLVFGVDQQNRNKFNVYSKEYTKESEVDEQIKEVIWKTMGNIPNKVFIKPHPKKLVTPRLAFNFHNPHTELITTLKTGCLFAFENNKFSVFTDQCCTFSLDKEIYCVKYEQNKGIFTLSKNDQIINSLYCKSLDVTDFNVFDNGNKLVYGCETGESFIINQPFGKNPLFVSLYGITDKVTAITYCIDYHTAVIASSDGYIRYFNEDGKIRQVIKTNEVINKMLFSDKNGDLITLSIQQSRTIITGYSINAYKFAETLINTTITAVTITHFIDGSIMNVLALGSDRGELMLYEVEKLELLGSCYGGRSLNSSKNTSKVLSVLFVENYSKLYFFVECLDGVDVLEIK